MLLLPLFPLLPFLLHPVSLFPFNHRSINIILIVQFNLGFSLGAQHSWRCFTSWRYGFTYKTRHKEPVSSILTGSTPYHGIGQSCGINTPSRKKLEAE